MSKLVDGFSVRTSVNWFCETSGCRALEICRVQVIGEFHVLEMLALLL